MMTPIGKYKIAAMMNSSFFIGSKASARACDLVEVITAAALTDIGSASVRVVDLMAADLFVSVSPVEGGYSCLSFEC
jgi:hypothetical protein